jgi:4-diphosphocytidyl-2-C-methyl-D-erythritol kinase
VQTITLFSPAKINLFFRVLNKRPDGYHNIASLIQAIDFGDTLSLSLQEDVDSFLSNESTLAFDERNLIYKAVALFKQKTHLSFHLNIHLDKKIPMQAGLGGGSGNAATTLYALNQLLHTQLSDETLAEWGSLLGADVPCFFSSGRVFCEGIGEKLTSLSSAKESYWIAKPLSLHLATPAVYAQCQPYPTPLASPHIEILSRNDLEEAAFSLLPTLKTFKEECLALGFNKVMMTGSGTAFICMGGEVTSPTLPNTQFIKAQSITRQAGEWYQHP